MTNGAQSNSLVAHEVLELVGAVRSGETLEIGGPDAMVSALSTVIRSTAMEAGWTVVVAHQDFLSSDLTATQLTFNIESTEFKRHADIRVLIETNQSEPDFPLVRQTRSPRAEPGCTHLVWNVVDERFFVPMPASSRQAETTIEWIGTPGMPSDFHRATEYLLDPGSTAQIVQDYSDYFSAYTGRYFEEFIARSDPNRFTCEDLAALGCLGVELKGSATVELLVTRADEMNELLNASDMPDTTADLRHVDRAVIAETSPLSNAYEQLKSIDGIGYVRASKLLAAKRPALVPIRDRVVETFLDAGEAWWAPYLDVVQDHQVVERVQDLSEHVPERVTLLRRVDVALWMAGKRQAASA